MGEIKITPIRLSLSTAYLLQDKSAILVDTGTAKDFPKILKALQTAGVRPEEIAMVLLTHGHADHAGSVAQLQGCCPNAKIVLHASDMHMVKEGQNAAIFSTGLIGNLVKKMFNKAPIAPFTPHTLLSVEDHEEWDLTSYGVRATVFKTPGHTAGSISIVTAEGHALIGDLLAGGYLNFLMTLTPTLPTYVYRDDIRDCIREIVGSLKKLLTIGVHTFHVGHGGPLKSRDVQEFVDNLRAKRGITPKSARQGAAASADLPRVQAGH